MSEKDPWEKHEDVLEEVSVENRAGWLKLARKNKRAVLLGICIGWALLMLWAISHPLGLWLTKGLPYTSKTTYTVNNIVAMAATGLIPFLILTVLETLTPEVFEDG